MNWRQTWAEAPSTALLILGTLAQQQGHQVKILHLDIEPVSISHIIDTFKPDIVGITVNTFQVKSARQIVKEIRETEKSIRIIIGGPHAIVWKDDADQVVVGEGENAWLELIGATSRIKSIDDIPMVDYRLVNLKQFCGISSVGLSPSMCMMASRGCPFSCIFCNTPVLWGKKVRFRSPQLVLDEIEYLHKTYGAKEIFLQDDTFNLNLAWAMEILEGIIRRKLHKEMVFRLCSRANSRLITKEYLDLAYRAGVWNIFFGIESGSQKMLDLMRKTLTVAEIKATAQMVHAAKISMECSFIVGLPGETLETLRETDKLINEIKPSRYGWCHACPFPFTAFDKEVTEKGHKRDIDYAEYAYGKQMVRTDELDYAILESFKGFTYA